MNRKNLGLESWLLNQSISLSHANLQRALDPLHLKHQSEKASYSTAIFQ